MYYDDEPPASSGCWPSLLLVLVAVAALGALFYFGLNRTINDLNPFRNVEITNPLAAAPTTIAIDRPTVLREMRALDRWETAFGAYDQVITAGQEAGVFYNFFRGDRLILIASGDVIAGFDMSELRSEDIQMSEDGSSVTVTLPPTKVLVSRLDNERTQVYDRQTGFLTSGNPGLESEARRAAEQRIVERACETGLLRRAADEGERNMANLLQALGFQNVEVYATAGSCPVSSAPAP
jgi:hypothetical protein